MIDFTYHFLDKSVIHSIRFNFKKTYLILTIYYSFFALIFNAVLEKFNYQDSLIYEWDKEHSIEFHKDKEPYELHIHIKLQKDSLKEILREFFKVNNLDKKDLINILNFLENQKLKYKNIEYKGSTKNKDLENFKNILKKEKFIYSLFHKEIYEITYLRISLQLLRYKIFNFNLSNKTLDYLKLIGSLKSRDEEKMILEMFSKIKNQPYRENLKIVKNKNWQDRLILKLIKFHKIENINSELLTIFLNAYYRYYYYNYYKKISLKNYLINRLNLELAWSLFQASKMLRNLGVKKYNQKALDNLKNNSAYLTLEKYLKRAYYLFYSRYQNFNNENNLNFMELKFKEAMELCYDKTSLIITPANKKTELMTTQKMSLFK